MAPSMTSSQWDYYFLSLAEKIAQPSKDPSTKVGAVIVDSKRRIISTGYNGFPRGVVDDPTMPRDRKLERTIHAELNAILFAQCDLSGCTIYVYPFQPCERCATVLVQAGIERVVSFPNTNPRWEQTFNYGADVFKQAGVSLEILPFPSISPFTKEH